MTAEDVGDGRPYPYMIFKLMKYEIASTSSNAQIHSLAKWSPHRDFHKKDVRRVVKVGDTVRDIEEGANAGVGV